jgi:hypothetical protein
LNKQISASEELNQKITDEKEVLNSNIKSLELNNDELNKNIVPYFNN